MHRFPAALALAAVLASPAFAQKTPIRITADLSDAPRKLFHAEVDLPVKPGEHATFITPQWIPGEHAPNGPAATIVGVVFTGNGQVLPWRRDDVNLYEFHVDIPAGVTNVHAHLDSIISSRISREMAVLEWQKLLLYPAHIPVKDIAVEPSVTVPAGWGIGTALVPAGSPTSPPPTTGLDEQYHQPAATATTQKFAVTTVEQLQDSPIITGKYFHEFALAPDVTPRHFIDVVSDQPGDQNLRPELLAELSSLVHEASAAYASHHYNAYHFLLTLSDIAGGEGLEHEQSSDNGVGEKGFSDADHQLAESDLLAHEFTHSWNGKYRRPEKLYEPDFATPQQGQLLWVYEGLTQYMGNVLAARSGLKSQAAYRDMLALSAASLDNESGRVWRSTEDTAIASSIARHPVLWAGWNRGQSYYQEGELVWLDADTLIREQTNGKKSLTDFLHIFLGKGGDTAPIIVPYDRKELIRDLNEVLPYDWAGFLHQRIDLPNPHTDLAGIERAGYKLVYTDKPSPTEKALAKTRRGAINVWYSLGFRIAADGTVGDIRITGPADKAMLYPGAKILAVNGHAFTSESGKDVLLTAIDDAKASTTPIHLTVQEESEVVTLDLDYHDGQRYASLERVEGKPDLLTAIINPLATK